MFASTNDRVARLRAEPEQTAIFLDVDGVLAPIVARPEDAAVPEETRTEVRRLHGKYALVACVSGRTSDDARRIVGLDELVYVGEHGLELEPSAPQWRNAIRSFADSVDWPVEDKGLTLSFHYRGVADEEAAEAFLLEVAERARDAGLRPRIGRKVLEIRPPVEASKGTAVRFLLEQRGLTRAMYAGDDTTDLDAFRVLEELELGLRVGVASPESPRAISEEADVVVRNPDEMLGFLRGL
jgi:trehalose 6-phosphate phosphatase